MPSRASRRDGTAIVELPVAAARRWLTLAAAAEPGRYPVSRRAMVLRLILRRVGLTFKDSFGVRRGVPAGARGSAPSGPRGTSTTAGKCTAFRAAYRSGPRAAPGRRPRTMAWTKVHYRGPRDVGTVRVHGHRGRLGDRTEHHRGALCGNCIGYRVGVPRAHVDHVLERIAGSARASSVESPSVGLGQLRIGAARKVVSRTMSCSQQLHDGVALCEGLQMSHGLRSRRAFCACHMTTRLNCSAPVTPIARDAYRHTRRGVPLSPRSRQSAGGLCASLGAPDPILGFACRWLQRRRARANRSRPRS